jgi:hypothetical protein
MDLSLLISSDTAECVIKNPHNGKPTDISITLYGMDSDTFRNTMKAAQATALKLKAEGKEPPEGKEVDAARLAELTKGWVGIVEGGKAVQFSKQSAVDIYTRSDEIRRQVDRFIFTVGNFLPKA